MFDLVDYKITVSAASLNVPEFKAIWKRDKNRTKVNAHAELSYVYYMCDYKSEYRNYPEGERTKEIKEAFITKQLGEKWKPDKVVQAAMDRYISMQETPSLRYLKSQEAMIDKVTDYMNSIKAEDFEDDDKLLTMVSSNSEKYNKI